MSSEHPRVYNYRQVADRVEQVLGERPSLSSLRAEAAKERQTSTTQARPRLTLQLPSPLPQVPGARQQLFSAEEVERWLQDHPRLRWSQAMARARGALEAGKEPTQVVEEVLEAGASWRNVTQLLAGVPDQPQTLTGVHKRYRSLKKQV